MGRHLRLIAALAWVGFQAGVGSWAEADIIDRSDHHLYSGKVISQNREEVVFQQDGTDAAAAQHISRAEIVRVILTDEHGRAVRDSAATQSASRWNVPAQPAAPPIAASMAGSSGHPTYYVIPLHGEVGDTLRADGLEKCLADAAVRKPSVVVLDINSPGGLTSESQKIIKILHQYNKKLRIVALADQDLSAAAIFTMSVKEIYLKSTGTIGAARAFDPTNLFLPPKIEEKMESAWRAVVRNSAEEGGHEPLLVDAMIDTDIQLHLEKVQGKGVIKEGPGDHMLCRKGRILTLSSHEAVDCGLASGGADDLDELGEALHMSKWKECAGMGALMADYLPKRAAALKEQVEAIKARFTTNVEQAVKFDPSQMVTTVRHYTTGVPAPAAPYVPRPGVPRGPMYHQTVTGHTTTIVTQHTGGNPLLCVIFLQQAEADLADAMGLYHAFGDDETCEALKDVLDQIGTARARVYDMRGLTRVPTTAGAVAHIDPVTKLPDKGVKTDILGGRGGNEFVRVGPTSQPMVGIRFTLGDWNGKHVIRTIDPFYGRLPANHAVDSRMQLAKEGYAVGGLMVDCDTVNTVAVQLIFMRVKDGKLDPSDSYKGVWVGAPDENEPRQLAGKGEMVIGICGRKGMNLDALGLVVLPAEATVTSGTTIPSVHR